MDQAGIEALFGLVGAIPSCGDVEQDEVVRARTTPVAAVEDQFAGLMLVKGDEAVSLGHFERFDQRTVETVCDRGQIVRGLSGH